LCSLERKTGGSRRYRENRGRLAKMTPPFLVLPRFQRSQPQGLVTLLMNKTTERNMRLLAVSALTASLRLVQRDDDRFGERAVSTQVCTDSRSDLLPVALHDAKLEVGLMLGFFDRHVPCISDACATRVEVI
jgi:hypothetical protein